MAWSFYRTGELPQHDHARVEGLEEEVEAAQETGRPERVLIGEAISIAEDKEHIHGAQLPEYDRAEALTAKEEGRK